MITRIFAVKVPNLQGSLCESSRGLQKIEKISLLLKENKVLKISMLHWLSGN